MGLEIRHEDGKTTFVCSRGPSESPEERQARWIGEEAARQSRCPLCLAPLADSCGMEKGTCQGEIVNPTVAVGILRGMVVG
jgi:hypothetical protein